MLQRVQTIYLILCIICLGIATSSNIGIYSFNEEEVDFSAIVDTKGVQFELQIGGETKTYEDIQHELEIGRKNHLINPKTIEVLKEGGREYPLYIPYITIICLIIWVIISYKNLKRQLFFARLNTLFSFLLFLGVVIGFNMGKTIGIKMMGMEGVEDIEIATGMGIGFFFSIAAFPFALLAQIAIKRDLKLIQSIDRIR